MNYFTIVTLITILFIPTFSHADGNKFLAQCLNAEKVIDTNEIKEPLDFGFCLGLIQGVRNTMVVMNESSDIKICLPEGGIRNDQGVRVVLSYLKKNPASLHKNEVFLTMLAFMDAYPCKDL